MKVIGYLPCHYGLEYLKESLLSVVDHVDKFVVLYSATPSYGHGAEEECPESREDIHKIASEVLGDKMVFVDVCCGNEAEHRDTIYNYTAGYDLILTIDADEVYDPEDVQNALEIAYRSDKKYIGIQGYINLWKSFDHACYDGFVPVRIINLANTDGQGAVPMRVYHFSTAQSDVVMRYKYEIHGHKDELRPDWLEKTYFGWTREENQKDLHPVAIGLWNATPFDKNTLPKILKDHPNFNKEVIG